MQAYDIIDYCLLCGGPTKLVLALGRTALANELLEHTSEYELFPLNLVQCQHKDCNHLQIDCIVPKERLYEYYLYVATTNQSNIDYFEKYAKSMIDKFGVCQVLDIGSNDGLLLSFMQKAGCEVLGVDPAKNIAALATKNGISTIPWFFNEETAIRIKNYFGKPKLITANNSFAHNADLATMAKGIKSLLHQDGTFVFEVAYAMKMLENNTADLLYHEHLHTHHLLSLVKFFKKFGLEIYHAEETPTHGGSIRVFVQHADKFRMLSINLEVLLDDEREFQELVEKFVSNVQKVKTDVIELLTKIKQDGKTIGILGYPAKLATLSAFFGLNDKLIDAVYDDNTLKHGRYSHQGHRIQDTSDMTTDYLFIGSWNYADFLIKKNSKYKGKFIVPLPKLKIV
jgi:SAM-dependent methyltransferase